MFIFAAYLSLFFLAKRGLNMTPKDLLIALRTQNPLVQCITNYVAMKVAANVVLAAGASPAMVHVARGQTLAAATAAAKSYVATAIANADALSVGKGHGPTQHFATLYSK